MKIGKRIPEHGLSEFAMLRQIDLGAKDWDRGGSSRTDAVARAMQSHYRLTWTTG
jgi:hypothetical protein